MKIAKGTNLDRLPKRPSKTVNGMPKKPKFLTERASAGWDELSVMLFDMGVLCTIDQVSLIGLCEVWADWRAAREEFQETGGRFTSESYNEKTGTRMTRGSPAYAAVRAADDALRRWLVEFGMTPSSRSRVQANPDDSSTDQDDPAAKFFGSPRAVAA